ncbi:MAG: sodium transporter [Calditrichaeota bacterium]|nr:MAG: sodium transporter [Calditrichota bacterium]
MASGNTFIYITILGYIFFVLFAGLAFSSRASKNSAEYFLANRNMGWIIIGISLFATNISSEHILGLSGAGAEHGLAAGSLEWLAVLVMIPLGWIFVPVFLKQGVFTTSEFLEKRFNRSSRIYLSSISLITYTLTKISITLYAGGLLLHAILGWDMYASAIFIVVVTGLYTLIGGMRAVLYTQIVQIFFIIGGAALVVYYGLNAVGGLNGLQAKLPADFFEMFKSFNDPDFPITGLLLGAPVLAIWYWCNDQYMVQRLLTARSVGQAQSATIFNGFLKILPVFLWVVPGMMAIALFPGVSGGNAYAKLISIIPFGLIGLVVASILAAMMSSLSSVFLSSSTLLTMDFYRTMFPRSSEKKMVLVGRLTTTLVVITAILWVPLTQLNGQQMYVNLQSMQAYISPPVAAVFLLGFFSKRVNGRAAIVTLVTGGIIGITRLIMAMVIHWAPINNSILGAFVHVNFLHFAFLLFVFSIVLSYGYSFLDKQVQAYGGRLSKSELVVMTRNYFTWGHLVSSFLLIMAVVGLWHSFA